MFHSLFHVDFTHSHRSHFGQSVSGYTLDSFSQQVMYVHITLWGKETQVTLYITNPTDCIFTLIELPFSHSHFTGGSDFASVNQTFSFQSGQTQCVNVSILRDSVTEVDESFTLELTLEYEPFDIALDTYNITIVDSGEIYLFMHSIKCWEGKFSPIFVVHKTI